MNFKVFSYPCIITDYSADIKQKWCFYIMKFNNEEIRKIAHLARININEIEANKVSEKLEGILGLIEQMTQVNTDGIEPMAHALDITQPLREDKVTADDIREKSLNLSQETDQSLFIVPKVIE